MMPLQRARDAESRVRKKSSNGPLRVQSNASDRRVFCNVKAYVSCQGYVSILIRARSYFREFKVAPRIKRFISSLTEMYFSVRDFFLTGNSVEFPVK